MWRVIPTVVVGQAVVSAGLWVYVVLQRHLQNKEGRKTRPCLIARSNDASTGARIGAFADGGKGAAMPQQKGAAKTATPQIAGVRLD